jgi:response regulator RpfG family c-di-GMP phosphodiesterase
MLAQVLRSDPITQKTTYIPKDSRHVKDLLSDLLTNLIVLPEDWEKLSPEVRVKVERADGSDAALDLLISHNLLTAYQANRVRAGTIFGLVLGNYRVLDRLGAGGMAVVFKGEHMELRNQVAIKVLPISPGQDPRLQNRFSSEMRIVARLRHPNIVSAMDCGRAISSDAMAPVLWYLVMEYVAGHDLEEFVQGWGPMPPNKACNLMHQMACALAEIHKFNLIHRDIKPSNILMTADEQAKLLDFGLSRHIDTRLTNPGTFLGTVDYMAPEQAKDASTVDIRADIYGLGGTLFWCLTGQLPFPPKSNIAKCMQERMTGPAPLIRKHVPELPAELEEVVCRMMAPRLEDRYQTPQAVMQAMLPFLKSDSWVFQSVPMIPSALARSSLSVGGIKAPQISTPPRVQRVLIVDDDPSIREFSRAILQAEGWQCGEVTDGPQALEVLTHEPYDLMLLDVCMPSMNGLEVLRRLRMSPPCSHFKVIMFSGSFSPDELAQLLNAGADDYLTKPFSLVQLQRKVQAALRLKEAQDRSDLLNRHLLAVNAELERSLSSRDCDLSQTRNALVLTLARLVAHRDTSSGAHLQRMQRYCRSLASEARKLPTFEGQIDDNFIEMLDCCAPLHDIGKVALPDHILLKPGKLSQEEHIVMQAHTIIGADTFKEVHQNHGLTLGFLQMAIDVTRHHHERYDGTGYPDRLAGNAIPLSARIVTICDVYDALRARRSYKPALSHSAALQMMTQVLNGYFDPVLLQVFMQHETEFERILRELPDHG